MDLLKIALVGLIGLLPVVPGFSEEKSAPLNILFIAADDLNTDIGCYGNAQVKTPNLNRLAAMGVRFDKAYCQQPLCGPSRASVMTGLRPNTSQFVKLTDDIRQLTPEVKTLGQYFQQQGYYVGRVGKIYHYGNPSQIGGNGHDDALTWMERFNPAGIDKTQEENIIRYPGGTSGQKGGLGISMAWWDPESADDDHTDGLVAAKAIEMIDAHQGEPFFVGAGFFNPHCPYVAPKKYFDMYPLEEITIPPLDEAKKDLEDVPPMAVQRDTRKWPYYFGCTEDEARRCKQAYYACVSFVDAQVGRLLDALEERELLDNTLIVFWSDHGYFLGEKGLWYKRKNFERSVRVPLLIAGPGVVAGQTVTRPVELLDLYPTLVDMAGFEIPADLPLDGQSLRPLLQDPAAEWSKPAISQVYHNKNAYGFSIRTDRWRYTEWKQGEAGAELYDHQNDPDEITNLAGSPEHTEIVAQLKTQLQPFTNVPSR